MSKSVKIDEKHTFYRFLLLFVDVFKFIRKLLRVDYHRCNKDLACVNAESETFFPPIISAIS